MSCWGSYNEIVLKDQFFMSTQ